LGGTRACRHVGKRQPPHETHLRLMFLKFRHRLGFELLCWKVSDSITSRQLCPIGLDQPVPHLNNSSFTRS
jgi:transposase, IS5 family